jgi:MFS family permease
VTVFQAVNGQSPLQAGLQILPYSLGSSVASIPTAWLIQYVQRKRGNTSAQKWVTITGLAIAAIGFGTSALRVDDCPNNISLTGLMLVMDVSSSKALQAVIALISGIGIGAVFHAPYQMFAARLGSHLASGTGAFFLVRFTGATLGLVSRVLKSSVSSTHSRPVYRRHSFSHTPS